MFPVNKSARSWFCLAGLFLTFAVAISVNRPARCSLDVEEGHCQEQFLRWFFNSKSGHCETFVYSGCGGNANNFNATMYCLLACNGTEADTHKYSITSNQTDQLKSGTEKIDPSAAIDGRFKRNFYQHRIDGSVI